MSQNDELARAKYTVEIDWNSLSKQQRTNIKNSVHEIAVFAERHFHWDLHRKAFDLEQLIKRKNASFSQKEFDSGDRVRLTKKWKGYVRGTVAEVDVYDWNNGTCVIRIQVDRTVLRGVPANTLTLL